jgi:hypothetical protein
MNARETRESLRRAFDSAAGSASSAENNELINKTDVPLKKKTVQRI